MKNRSKLICSMIAFLVATLLFAGCSQNADHITISATSPLEEDRLTIYTPLPEAIYLPIVQEFENRTGIWVEVETGNAIPKLESVSAGEANSADLLFGCQPDVVERYREIFALYDGMNTSETPEEYTSVDGLWHPFAINHLVVVYNSKLLSEYRPNSWKGILQSGWNKQVAYVSLQKSDVGIMTLRTIAEVLDISRDEVLPMLSSELEYDTCDKVLEAVTHGKCYFGIVPEDVAIRAIANDSDIDIIYPKEGTLVYPSTMAVFDSCVHEANAQRFIEFIQEMDVQKYLEENYAMHSIYKQIMLEDVGTLLKDYFLNSPQGLNGTAEKESDQSEEVSE